MHARHILPGLIRMMIFFLYCTIFFSEDESLFGHNLFDAYEHGAEAELAKLLLFCN